LAKPPKRKKLKVFRTPIGFHDAYVAAPSMKAALEAWGSSTNLFSQGAAEVVTDPKLTKAPLARPGEVVRVPRGSEGEHFKALGRTKKAKKEEGGSRIPRSGSRAGKSGMTTKKKRGRRPSSAAVERAEAALARAEVRHRDALDGLRAEAAAIDKKRREVERKQRGERDRLTGELDEAREKFRSAMEEWAR
jgi:hypothetical protein